MLELAYQNGIRYFDAAPGYGMAESMLLEWLVGKKAPDIQIGTKWGYTYTADFRPYTARHELKEHSLDKLREQWAISRQLLPNLRLYQVHSATFESGVLSNQPVLDELGRIRAEYEGLRIGLTTTGAEQVEVFRAAQAIQRDGRPLFTAFQFTFNVLEQSFYTEFEGLIDGGYLVIVKEALANGRLLSPEGFPQYAEALDYLTALARKYGVGSDAVALRYVMDRIPVAVVLSGASTPAQLESNTLAADFRLDPTELDRLSGFAIPPSIYWDERKRLPWN